MTEPLKLSVVMATYNRAETVRETLNHLADQDLDPASYEVIVIDDGSPDNTEDVIRTAASSMPFALTYLRHANHGPGYTQNRGIRIAKAPVILLMADDIFMSRQTLSAHLSMHQSNPGQEVAVLGRVAQSPKLTQNVFMRTWDPMRFSEFDGQTELPYYRFWACNISVKRDFILEHGPFREPMGRAGAAAHEDPELGYRLHKAGLRILYCPQALGHHYHIVTLDQACGRSYQRGLNFGEFRKLAPEPEIPVAYHVFNLSTIRDHITSWRGPRRDYLPPGDRNPISLLLRYTIHMLVFNGITVPLFWRPLLDRAEQNPAIASRLNRDVYRAMLFYHFLRGVRDGNRKFGDTVPSAGIANPA